MYIGQIDQQLQHQLVVEALEQLSAEGDHCMAIINELAGVLARSRHYQLTITLSALDTLSDAVTVIEFTGIFCQADH